MRLDDLLVLELSTVLAGPSVGQFFAELGATVLKLEPPHGDVTRRWRLPSEDPGSDRPAYFCACNWGKRSVVVDLGQPAGQEIVQGLATRADVVVASYKPGAAEKLGVDAATLRRLNPRLIYAHLTGYGPEDPRPGYDAIIQAESGFMYLNGERDGPPLKMPVALMDLLAAHQLKEALLLALLQREHTGEGTTITLSLYDAAVTSLANQATNWLVAGHAPTRTGSEHPNIAPYGSVYQTADARQVVLAVGTDRQFDALCQVLGLEDLPLDPRFRDNAARVRHRSVLNTLLQEKMAQWDAGVLLRELASHQVPAGVVNDLPTVWATPAARSLILQGPPSGLSGGAAGVRQIAFRSGENPEAPPISPPPGLGADTRDVLRTYLQLPDAIIDDLASAGVLYLGSAE